MKKHKKSKDTGASSMIEQDVVGLLTTLVQKLTSFEAKIDMVYSKLQAPPVAMQQQRQPTPIQAPQARIDSRPMHKAICADCHKECEVPFRPSADRPVYCKKCYAMRKNNSGFKVHGNGRQMNRPAASQIPEKPQISEPAKAVKPAKKKRTARKKK